MIKIFGKTDQNFTSNGDKIINPLRAQVHEEDNGDFYLEIEASLDDVDYFAEGNIIVAPTPIGEQAFRVTNPQKSRRKVTTKAYHVFYDAQNYLIADSYVVDMTCQQALDHLLDATEPSVNPFTATSDILHIDSYRCVRTSLYDAIQTVIERWGGHLVRDNFTFGIRQSIGSDNGVVIRYAKNLKEITSQENWSAVVTKLLPVGRDGILLNALDPTADIYLTSSVQYDLPYTKSITFEQTIDENAYERPDGTIDEQAYKTALVDDLRAQAQAYLDENCVPKVNYTLKANLQTVTGIGDSIEVIDERLGIDIFTNVISYTYDCILGQYKEIEFGNFTQKLSNLLTGIDSQVRQAETLAMQSTDAIWQTLQGSYVVYQGDKMLVLDAIPQSSAVNVIKIDSDGISFSSEGVNGTFKKMVDVIVEEGTSSGWTYKKYLSGKVELSCVATLSSLTWSALGSLYTSSGAQALPFSVSNPKVTVQVDGSTVAWTSYASVSSSQVAIGLVAGSQPASLDVSIIVTGG